MLTPERIADLVYSAVHSFVLTVHGEKVFPFRRIVDTQAYVEQIEAGVIKVPENAIGVILFEMLPLEAQTQHYVAFTLATTLLTAMKAHAQPMAAQPMARWQLEKLNDKLEQQRATIDTPN